MTRPLDQFEKDMRYALRAQIGGMEYQLTLAPFRGATKMRRELAALRQLQQRFLAKRRRDGLHVFDEGRAGGLSHDTAMKIVSGVLQCVSDRYPAARQIISEIAKAPVANDKFNAGQTTPTDGASA
jgi:hypothetical protein